MDRSSGALSLTCSPGLVIATCVRGGESARAAGGTTDEDKGWGGREEYPMLRSAGEEEEGLMVATPWDERGAEMVRHRHGVLTHHSGGKKRK